MNTHSGRTDAHDHLDPFVSWGAEQVVSETVRNHAGADQDRARDQFDAIADMFLGEVGTDPGGSASGPADGSTGESDHDRRRDAPAGSARPEPSHQEAAPQGRAPAGRHISFLVLANLPVHAGIWANQYARLCASERGATVGVCRLSENSCQLTTFSPDRSGRTLRPAESDFEAALASSDHWIIRADRETLMELVEGEAPDGLTILTAADHPAILGAYATLKDLLGSFPSHSRGGMGVTLAVVSPAESEALRAGGSIARTALEHLNVSLDVVWCPDRIEPSPAPNTAYSGPLPCSAEELVGALRKSSAQPWARGEQGAGEPISVESDRFEPSQAGPSEPTGVAEPARLDEGVVSWAGESRVRESVPDEYAHSEAERTLRIDGSGIETGFKPNARPNTKRGGEPDEELDAETVAIEVPVEARSASATRSADQARAVTDRDPVRLAEFTPGLRGLAITCPYAPGVQFACDAEGSLHALAMSSDPEQTLADLQTCVTWASQHASLLAPHLPTRSPNPGQPTAHLFVREAKPVRRLLETPTRVHLLAPVETPAGPVWFHTELN